MYSKHARVLVAVMGAILALGAIFAGSAAARETAKGYSEFAGCPSPEENPSVLICVATQITGGHFKMGSKEVPISKPMTLTGGATAEKFVFNSKGGLSKARQLVPGGVIGLTGLDWLVNFLNIEALQLYATTELAGEVGSPFMRPQKLPIKVHLENPVLGNSCYVGSTSNPIMLNLTTETTSPPPPNKPISGREPEIEVDPTRPGVVLSHNGVYVDNSFSAPKATGCVLTLFGFIPISLNDLVDAESGLPAAAGTNETVQNFNLNLAPPENVYP